MSDELDREILTETGEETLKRVGRSQVRSNSSRHGLISNQDVVYPTQEYKVRERYQATGENPDDADGNGYQFTNTTNKGVG